MNKTSPLFLVVYFTLAKSICAGFECSALQSRKLIARNKLKEYKTHL